jgi:hypothetical protein
MQEALSKLAGLGTLKTTYGIWKAAESLPRTLELYKISNAAHFV